MLSILCLLKTGSYTLSKNRVAITVAETSAIMYRQKKLNCRVSPFWMSAHTLTTRVKPTFRATACDNTAYFRPKYTTITITMYAYSSTSTNVVLGWEIISMKKIRMNIPMNSPNTKRKRYWKSDSGGMNPCYTTPSNIMPREVPMKAPTSCPRTRVTATFQVNLDYFLIRFMRVIQGLKLAPQRQPEMIIPKRREMVTCTSIPSLEVQVMPQLRMIVPRTQNRNNCQILALTRIDLAGNLETNMLFSMVLIVKGGAQSSDMVFKRVRLIFPLDIYYAAIGRLQLDLTSLKHKPMQQVNKQKAVRVNKDRNDKSEQDQEKEKEKPVEQKYEQIPQLMEIDKFKKPIISRQRKQDLKEKLELEMIGQVRVREREKTNNLILSFDQNIHVDKFHNKAVPASRNIVDQVQNLRGNQVSPDYQASRQKFKEEMQDQLLFSKLIQTNFNRNDFSFGPKQEKRKIVEAEKEKHWIESLPVDLLEICKMQQQNIYLKKNKSINVFKEAQLSVRNDRIRQSFLEQNHFIQKSVLESFMMTPQVKIESYKHISKLARLLAANTLERFNDNEKIKKTKDNVQDYYYEADITFDISNLGYRTMMNIASGRFTSLFFSNAVLQIQDAPKNATDDLLALSLSERSDKQDHQQQQTGVGTSTQQQDMDKFQRDCMIKAPYIDNEEATSQTCKKLLELIKNDIEAKKVHIGKNIVDKSETKAKRKINMDRIGEFKAPKYSDKDIKNKFQQNRKLKDKQEYIRLETFNQALKLEITHHDILEKIRTQNIYY